MDAPVELADDVGDVGLLDIALSGWFRAATQEAAPGFAISSSDRVADIGSGDGGIALFCSRYAAETFLVDQDADRLAECVRRVSSEAIGPVQGHVGDAARLPLPDGWATRIVCTEVLEHVDEPAQALAELYRIGEPGALYLISVPGMTSEHLFKAVAPAAAFEKPHHIHIFSDVEIERLVRDAGLVIERRYGTSFFWSMWWLIGWALPGDGEAALRDWKRIWWRLLHHPHGLKAKQALDLLAPKSNVIIARKPA